MSDKKINSFLLALMKLESFFPSISARNPDRLLPHNETVEFSGPRWVSVRDQLPTQCDADVDGDVFVRWKVDGRWRGCSTKWDIVTTKTPEVEWQQNSF